MKVRTTCRCDSGFGVVIPKGVTLDSEESVIVSSTVVTYGGMRIVLYASQFEVVPESERDPQAVMGYRVSFPESVYLEPVPPSAVRYTTTPQGEPLYPQGAAFIDTTVKGWLDRDGVPYDVLAPVTRGDMQLAIAMWAANRPA